MTENIPANFEIFRGSRKETNLARNKIGKKPDYLTDNRGGVTYSSLISHTALTQARWSDIGLINTTELSILCLFLDLINIWSNNVARFLLNLVGKVICGK